MALFLADQGTKWIVVNELVYGERIQVLPFFAWVRWHNAGAAFSFLADAGGWQRWFFVVIGLGFSAYVVRELSRLTLAERWMGLVYGLILGGALGNLYGRLVNGYVVDFILVHYEQHIFPAFNVADSALFCGVVIWIVLMIAESRAAKNCPMIGSPRIRIRTLIDQGLDRVRKSRKSALQSLADGSDCTTKQQPQFVSHGRHHRVLRRSKRNNTNGFPHQFALCTADARW